MVRRVGIMELFFQPNNAKMRGMCKLHHDRGDIMLLLTGEERSKSLIQPEKGGRFSAHLWRRKCPRASPSGAMYDAVSL